ncbi:hypothetical protein [Streptomyces sp. WAC08241]|uniref:hypothetical protein n=1 Tax=Streptomyces sp. WAC08241 TaxID=2487421 RepID=UPI000F782648|nr:hypothetical protein [Streptomyces sp. WAC08241]RSS42762.1 hypothetical protein EF906_11495 [Streptomyces sp. WAC08241]
MTTMPPRNEESQDFPVSPLLNSTVDDLLAQIEHEAKCRRREARALRRRIRRQRRKVQPLHLRVVRTSSTIASAGLALIGAVAFAASGIMFLLGDVVTAKSLLALASAAWSGAAGVVVLSRR